MEGEGGLNVVRKEGRGVSGVRRGRDGGKNKQIGWPVLFLAPSLSQPHRLSVSIE